MTGNTIIRNPALQQLRFSYSTLFNTYTNRIFLIFVDLNISATICFCVSLLIFEKKSTDVISPMMQLK